MKPPAFQFYADDFLAGTSDMTDSEAGLYIRLLCAQWNRGGLPNDLDELLRFSRGSTTLQAERVRRKFEVCQDGQLRNARLEDERQKQAVWREKSRLGGKKSGVVRNSTKGGSTVVQPPYEATPQPNGNSPLSTLHSPSNTPTPLPATPPPPPSAPLVGFEEFWNLYPRKQAKQSAVNAWKRVALQDHPKIMANVSTRIRQDPQWTKDDGAFIPHPASYLNKRRWNDETTGSITAPKAPANETPEERKARIKQELHQMTIDAMR